MTHGFSWQRQTYTAVTSVASSPATSVTWASVDVVEHNQPPLGYTTPRANYGTHTQNEVEIKPHVTTYG